MPIYAYKCSACGFAKDVLQKLSDAPLSECPSCGESTFGKQLTAAGFQLKGSGWYVTDFRDGGGAKKGGDGKDAADKGAADKSTPAESGAEATKPADAPAAASTAPAAAPAAAPAPAPVSTPKGD